MRALCLLVLVAGCASRPSIIVCAPVPTYSAVEQRKLAAELPADGPMSQRMILDYQRLADELRAKPVSN